MTLKHFLLGSAAGLMAATGAQAADLGTEAPPAAVDYVKVCDAFGAGFFYIPGTETCLDVSGRVRFTTRYISSSVDVDGEGEADADRFRWTADARVDFDARTATEFGTLRSFFRVQTTGDDTGVEVGNAFLQLGYLTAGYVGTPVNVDMLYGISDQTYFDYDTLQVSVLVDDLGGGFYAGLGVVDNNGGDLDVSYGDGVGGANDDFNGSVVGRIGIADQAWGGVDLSAGVAIDGEQNPTRFIGGLVAGSADDLGLADADGVIGVTDSWFVKGTADLSLIEGVNARLVAAYSGHEADGSDIDILTLAGAVSFAATDTATLYAGVRYDNLDFDGSELDLINANLGVDYTVASGLVATGEFNYTNVDADGVDADSFAVIGRLTRNW